MARQRILYREREWEFPGWMAVALGVGLPVLFWAGALNYYLGHSLRFPRAAVVPVVWFFGIAWPWAVFGRRRVVQISGWGLQIRTWRRPYLVEVPARRIAAWQEVRDAERTSAIRILLRGGPWRTLPVKDTARAVAALSASRQLSLEEGSTGRPVVESSWLSLGILLVASTVYLYYTTNDNWLGLPEIMLALPLLALLVRRGETETSAYERHALVAAILVAVCLDLYGFAAVYAWIGQHDAAAFNDSARAVGANGHLSSLDALYLSFGNFSTAGSAINPVTNLARMTVILQTALSVFAILYVISTVLPRLTRSWESNRTVRKPDSETAHRRRTLATRARRYGAARMRLAARPLRAARRPRKSVTDLR